MVKARLNYIIDILMGISFSSLFFTGLVRLHLIRQILGLRTAFRSGEFALVHDISGVIFGTLVIVHFLLHWNWFKCMTANLFRGKKCED